MDNEEVYELTTIFHEYLKTRNKSRGSSPSVLLKNWDGVVTFMIAEWWDEVRAHWVIQMNSKDLRDRLSELPLYQMYTDNLSYGNLFAVFFKGKRVAGFWKIWHGESIHIVHLLHKIPVEYRNTVLYSAPAE